MSPATLSTRASAAGLLAIAGAHAAWATGSPWPLRDRRALADKVVGREGGEVPGPTACLAICGLLSTGATFVLGHPRATPRLSRLGAAGVVATLAVRGGLGLAGRTDVVSPGSTSQRFRDLDRRLYSPLAVVLAVSAVPAVTAPHG